MVLSASVEEITLESFTQEWEVALLCHSLAQATPSTTHISIPSCYPDHEESGIHKIDFSSFRHLRVLEMCNMRWEGWKALADCTALEVVKIQDGDPNGLLPPVGGLEGPTTTADFLRIMVASITFNPLCRPALLGSSMPDLRDLKVISLREEDGDATGVMCSRSPLLEKLEIRFDYYTSRVTNRTFEAISTLTKLRDLKLFGGGLERLDVDDRAMYFIAASLKDLRRLDIGFRVLTLGFLGTRITSRGLFAVLEGCKHLEYICSPVAAPMDDPATHPTPVPNTALLVASLYHWGPLPTNLQPLATGLAARCPRLDTQSIRLREATGRLAKDCDRQDEFLAVYTEARQRMEWGWL